MLTAIVAALLARGVYSLYRGRRPNVVVDPVDPIGASPLQSRFSQRSLRRSVQSVIQSVFPSVSGSVGQALVICFLISSPAGAQNGPSTGIGLQLGSPSGVSVKLVRDVEPYYDFLAAWDLGDFLYVSGHAVWEKKVDEEIAGDLRMFYGPGAFIGFRDNRNSDVVLGFSGAIGASLWYEMFEFFLQLTPHFELVPQTDFDLGGGIGARFHIGRS